MGLILTHSAPAAERDTTAHAVATGAHLEAWDRHLSEGQPWPDVIEYTAT